MKAHSTSTDNTHAEWKVALRRLAIKDLEEIRVLDMFAGENRLWSKIDKDYYYGIEQQKGKGKNLYADNLKVIPSLDLSRFTVIDCDSYGIPYQQIKLVFENPTLQDGTVVIYTCISSPMSRISQDCIEDFDLENIYKKTKVLINKFSSDYFFEMLRKKGVMQVYEYEVQDSYLKKYGFFKVKKP